jgi:DnaJ-class molecular chaperone
MSLEALGLAPDATAEDVRDAWRKLAAIHHPDRGGDAAEFSKWRSIMTAALEEVSQPKRCPECRGAGAKLFASGWTSITVTCQDCKGTGKVSK